MSLLTDSIKTITLWLRNNFFALILTGVIIPVGIFVYDKYYSEHKDHLKKSENIMQITNEFMVANIELSNCLSTTEGSVFSTFSTFCAMNSDIMKGMVSESKEHYIKRQKMFFEARENIINKSFKYNGLDDIYFLLDKLESGLSTKEFSQELLELNNKLEDFYYFLSKEYNNATK